MSEFEYKYWCVKCGEALGQEDADDPIFHLLSSHWMLISSMSYGLIRSERVKVEKVEKVE